MCLKSKSFNIMENKMKIQSYKKLEKKIKNNEFLIELYKILSPICMSLFVLTAFFKFYVSLDKLQSNYSTLFTSVLIVLFGALTVFYFTINKKEKENKIIISKLYN